MKSKNCLVLVGIRYKGIKKSITIDSNGFPPNADCIQINTANTSEKAMQKTALRETNRVDLDLINHIQTNLCDGGYYGQNFIKEIKNEFGIEIQITKRTDIANGIVAKTRWISERTFAWMDKCRRLSKNYEGTFRSVKSVIVICFIRLLVRRLTGNYIQKWPKKVVVEI
jgi:transposase